MDTVLIVQPDPLLSRLARRTLVRSGHRVLEAEGESGAAQLLLDYPGRLLVVVSASIMRKSTGLLEQTATACQATVVCLTSPWTIERLRDAVRGAAKDGPLRQ